jgi:PEP-CTERM motif-containing protein
MFLPLRVLAVQRPEITQSVSASLLPETYDLSFDLAGSQNNDVNTTRLFFGEISNLPITKAAHDPFTTLGESPGQRRSEHACAIEPTTMLLIVTGLAGFGLSRRTRRTRGHRRIG